MGGHIQSLISAVKNKAKEHNLKEPYLVIEPGRSIVGEAGITLYTVGAIKEITGIKKYVAIDGGMFENPRYALYQSKYTRLSLDSTWAVIFSAAPSETENPNLLSVLAVCTKACVCASTPGFILINTFCFILRSAHKLSKMSASR